MPGLVAFGRRWSVGSDDLFLPSLCLCFIHSIWLIVTNIALVVEFEKLTNSKSKEYCGPYLVELIVSAIVLFIIGLILEISLLVISLRGSILNDSPRKPAQYLIYILLVVLCIKLVWSGFGVAWIHHVYFHCETPISKQVILGLVICTWFVFLSLLITTWCTYDGAGRSWVKMKRYVANRKEFEMKYPTYRRSGSRHRNWRQRKVIRAYQDSWNHRCRLLFCCIHSSERNRDSFADLARLLSEFFRDLDVVPSDVIVALVLLRRLQRLEQCSIVKQKRNNTYEFLSGIAITPKTRFVAMNDPKDLETFRNVVHFMHYASAAYGWPWYVIPNGFKGVWNLCSNLKCCCFRPDLSGVVLEDNCCYCNYAVIPTVFDSGTFDVIYATYHVDVGETPFFVVVDYNKQAIVVSIRGTLSLKDVITDLNAEGEPLPIEPPREDWIGHKGIVQAAVYMKSKLIGEKILEKAFNRLEGRRSDTYRLVLVGHSLGAGTAAILAVLLRDEYPTLECYAFSPPGGLLSMPVVEYTKSFVTSVIVGKDLVPRIGLSQMEALRSDLINAMKKSHNPKWQTLMSGIACCCCLRPEFAMPQRLSSAPSIQSEEFMRSRRSLRDLREVTINPNESAISLTVHQPMYPPGRIMHIVRHHPKRDEIKYESLWRRVIKKGEPVFQALWTENTDYGQVLISPGMIQDHMPDQVLSALHRVVSNHGPAKPQRTLVSSTSPLTMSKDSLLENTNSEVKPGSPHKLCMETSFTNVTTTPKDSPKCTLMNPSPLIIDADADVENDGELTPTNICLTNLLASFNLSWEYVTNMQDKFIEKEENLRLQERRTSLGNNSSSGCSEAGSTLKEIFGPLKYEDWMAPLASPETLSEISSMSSRASFFLPKDQSPLLRMKGGRNGHGHSSSLHRHNKCGKTNSNTIYASSGNGNNFDVHHHNRSLSCTYPENSEVLIDPSTTSVQYNTIDSSDGQLTKPNINSQTIVKNWGRRNETETTNFDNDPNNSEVLNFVDEHKKNGETTKRVSFNLKRKFASKDSGCSVGDFSYPSTPGSRYEPTYPIFSHQEEYGVPSLNSPHYTYCGQSPVDSPDIVFTSPSNGTDKFLFPEIDPLLIPRNIDDASSGAAETHH